LTIQIVNSGDATARLFEVPGSDRFSLEDVADVAGMFSGAVQRR
jgi:hypothetical protein